MSTSPAELVDRYLQLCEDRDLDEASKLLAPGVRLVFPGGKVYTSLQQMAGAASGNYRWVRKRRERYFEAAGDGSAGAVTVVTSLGTLYGEDLEGEPFSEVRYADVFVLRDGLIVEQNVFNDLPEAGIIRIPHA